MLFRSEAREIRSAAAAFQVYAKQAGLSLEMQNKAAEIKLRAERRCGELLEDMAERGERATDGKPSHDVMVSPPTLADLHIEPMQSSRWQKIAAIPEATFDRYIADKRDSGQEITTAGLLARGDNRPVLSSESYEWYTPPLYVEAARRVLGGIDLDPASCARANEIIKADAYFTREDDGLAHPWPGRVFLNPPYSGLAGPFTAKLLAEYEARRTTAAIVLVSAHMTETAWFAPLWDYLLCFTDHRIPFWTPGTGPQTGPTHGSVFVYLGHQPESFAQEFEQHGVVVCRWKPEFLRQT